VLARRHDKGFTMRGRNRGATIAVGIGLTLAGALPAGQAKAPVLDRPAASFYSARALNALDARWNAEARRYGIRVDRSA